MDPGAPLQSLGQVGRVVQRAFERSAPLVFNLHLRKRAGGAQFGVEPAKSRRKAGEILRSVAAKS